MHQVVDSDEKGVVTVLYITDGVEEVSEHDLDKEKWRLTASRTKENEVI